MAFLIVFGVGTVLLGAAYFITTVVTRARYQGTPNWPTVTGNVQQTFVYQHDRSTSEGTITTFTPVVLYGYTVDSRVYEGSKRKFIPYDQSSFRSEAEADMITARYTPGSEVPVYYNPANPAQAILEKPKATAHIAVLLYGIVCMLLGGGMIALGILW
ncbi:MAG: DUF3592 domain-containing protein [Anaerolineae bacterium]|nr:DUF3592 domain-containing protein [Anaerolineae bacterium]